ncbi:MAG: CopD family protein [Alphaproteobacteria bacterium]|nr:CopD family protein [Alphaproteobacteria bacterium]
MGLWIAVHILAAVFWVGGMYFAHQCLRPAAELHLPPEQRLVLWRGVLRRFFSRVWMAIAALLISGYMVVFIYLGGFASLGLHVHVMQATGWIMIGLYLHVYFGPYRRLKERLNEQDFAGAGVQQAKIRKFVGINLVLGLITILLGATGRYWASNF